MDKIVDAVLRLQAAFAAEGMSPPGIVLAQHEDAARLFSKLDSRTWRDPALQGAKPHIAGSRIYEPHEIDRGDPWPMTPPRRARPLV